MRPIGCRISNRLGHSQPFSVLFELIGARYERRSILIHPFGDWGKVFPDPAMTLAAVD